MNIESSEEMTLPWVGLLTFLRTYGVKNFSNVGNCFKANYDVALQGVSVCVIICAEQMLLC